MSLKDVLQEFMNGEEWEDEIQHDDSDNTDFVNTQIDIDGQIHTLLLLTDDDNHLMQVAMFSPIVVPKERRNDACVLVNGLNNRMRYGNLLIQDSGNFAWRWAVNVEGIIAAPIQIANMFRVAVGAFDTLRRDAMGAAAFSKQSGKELLDNYFKASEEAI
jgi:hypothetical protein